MPDVIEEEEDFVRVPKSVLRATLTKTLEQLARKPTAKHAGTRLRVPASVFFPEEMLAEELSPQHGLPPTDPAVGIMRNEDGELLPAKVTVGTATYRYKLQDPTHLNAWARFEKRMPELGHGAARLLLSRGGA